MCYFDVAINMGCNSAQTALLRDIGKDLGFKHIEPFSTMQTVENLAKRTANIFCLFATDGDFGALRPMVRSIRKNARMRVRFSPLVCFVEAPLPNLISQCIQTGFDDIVTLPWESEKLGVRLSRLINTQITYHESPDYFGPDRNRFRTPKQRHTIDLGRSSAFRRIEIKRDPVNGVQILGDASFGKNTGGRRGANWSIAV